jgi:hypothetical protein
MFHTLSGSIVACASAAHYTSYAGAAPVEIANSDHTRHRLSRSGQPPVQLRDPLHRITASPPQPGRRHLLPTEARPVNQAGWYERRYTQVITKRPGRTSRHRAGLRGPEPNGTIGAPGLSGRSSSHIRRRRDGFTHLAPRRHDGPAGATASSCARTRREHHDGGTAGAEGEIKHRVLLGSRRSMRRGCSPADLHHVGGRYPISAPRVPIQWCLLLAGPQMRRDVVAALTAFSRRRRCGRRPIARDEVTLGNIRRGRLVLDVGRLGSSRGTGDHQADPASASFSCRPPTHPSSRR